MVNLKYIDNPFTDDMMYSIECFRDEKLFYDCIERKILNSNSVFENLGSSFHTYLLTGDCEEWIGYVLFHNRDCINGYIKVIELQLEKLLLNLKKVIITEQTIDDINKLINSLKGHRYSDTVYLSELDEKIKLLKNNCVNENKDTISYFNNYSSNVLNYLYNFKEYYYLDIVIGLPFDTNRDSVESVYYGFIREVYQNVENLIRIKFNNIPIILKNTSSSLYLVNKDESKLKILSMKSTAN